jgi:hypothetical protein
MEYNYTQTAATGLLHHGMPYFFNQGKDGFGEYSCLLLDRLLYRKYWGIFANNHVNEI